MNDLKIPVILLILILSGAGYFVYNKVQNPQPKVKNKVVKIVTEEEKKEEQISKEELADDCIKKAGISFKKGDYVSALNDLKDFYNSDDYDVQHMLGYCYSSLKDYDKGILAFEKALKIKKMPIDGYSLAYLYELTGRYAAAACLYEELALEELPQNLKRSVLEGIARISGFFADNSRFLKYCKDLVDSYPESSDGAVNLLKILRTNKDYSGIDAVVNQTLKYHDKDFAYNYGLAQLYDEAGNTKQAVKFYKKCLKLKPETYAPFMDCYNALMKADERAAAVKALEYFLDGKQAYPTIYFNAALEANKLKKYKTALRLYINAVCNDVKLQGKEDQGLVKNVEKEYNSRGSELEKSFVNAFICYLNGDCAYSSSELKRIEADIQNTVYKDDYDLVVKANNRILQIDKKREEEIEAYNKKLEDYKNKLKADEAAKRLKAKLAEKSEKDQLNTFKNLTDGELKKLALKSSKDFNEQINIGDELWRRGNLADAKLCYSLAMGINSRASVPYIRLSKLHLSEKNYERAIEYVEKGLKNEPDNVEMLVLGASAYTGSNDSLKSMAYAEKAYSIKPGDTQAIIVYARACMLCNNFAKASELINEGLSKEKNNINRAALLNVKRKIEKSMTNAEETNVSSEYN